MGRNIKGGIPYYPVEVMPDRKMKLLVARFGFAGRGLMEELRALIYGDGYYIEWDEDSRLLFASENNSTIEFVDEVIEYCLKIKLLDDDLFRQYGILTSAGIQRRYLEAVWKRVEVVMYEEFLLTEIKKPDWSKTDIRVIPLGYRKAGTSPISDIGPISDGYRTEPGPTPGGTRPDIRNQQSRVEESKVEESRVNSDYMHGAPSASAPEEDPCPNPEDDDDGFGELNEPEIPKRMSSINGTLMAEYGRQLKNGEISLVDQMLKSHTASRICRELTDQKARAPTNPVNYVATILTKANPTKKQKLPPVTDSGDEEVIF
jgi:hypothetical protein